MNKEQIPAEKIWEWIPCSYDVKRISKDTETTWNLSPSISLKIPTENGTIDPLINLNIDQSRPFIFTSGLGWNWHKSWNLPDIGLELEITDPSTTERLAPPNKIYAKILIVKPTVTPMKTFHLLEVGVKGNQKVDLENGKCVFSGLKFNTTSYNHDHQKFHIIITLYLYQSKFELPQILESRISPPIFVDSRKSARDVQGQKIEKLKSYFDPFPPEMLEKSFKHIKNASNEVIKNSIDGLINYFSAPNIRHKVKHPLFLAMKFSACIKLYINTQCIKLNEDHKQLLSNIQYVLYKSSNQNVNTKLETKYILLVVESGGKLVISQINLKKITEFLDPLNNDSITVLIDPVDLPQIFQPLEQINQLQKAYEIVYDRLSQYRKDEMEDNIEDQYQRRKKKEQTKEPEPMMNADRIRKIIQIQGPNVTYPKPTGINVIEQAEKLMENQAKDIEGIKQEEVNQHQISLNNPLLQLIMAMQSFQQQQK